jgi:hypothetical protein
MILFINIFYDSYDLDVDAICRRHSAVGFLCVLFFKVLVHLLGRYDSAGGLLGD